MPITNMNNCPKLKNTLGNVQSTLCITTPLATQQLFECHLGDISSKQDLKIDRSQVVVSSGLS